MCIILAMDEYAAVSCAPHSMRISMHTDICPLVIYNVFPCMPTTAIWWHTCLFIIILHNLFQHIWYSFQMLSLCSSYVCISQIPTHNFRLYYVQEYKDDSTVDIINTCIEFMLYQASDTYRSTWPSGRQLIYAYTINDLTPPKFQIPAIYSLYLRSISA